MQTSILCFLSFGLAFSETAIQDFGSYGLFLKIGLTLAILLACAWVSEKLTLHQKLSNITSTRFRKQEVFLIIFTEVVIGNLAYYGFCSLAKVIRGSEITCLHVLSIYLLVFSVYHNGEFMFVLWCHPQDTSWKSKFKYLTSRFPDIPQS